MLRSARARTHIIDPCALVAASPPSTRPVATALPWGLPPSALSQIAFAGLTPVLGNLVYHDHVHLDVIVNGAEGRRPGRRRPCRARRQRTVPGQVDPQRRLHDTPLLHREGRAVPDSHPQHERNRPRRVRPSRLVHAGRAVRRMGRPFQLELPRRVLHGRRRAASRLRGREARRGRPPQDRARKPPGDRSRLRRPRRVQLGPVHLRGRMARPRMRRTRRALLLPVSGGLAGNVARRTLPVRPRDRARCRARSLHSCAVVPLLTGGLEHRADAGRRHRRLTHADAGRVEERVRNRRAGRGPRPPRRRRL